MAKSPNILNPMLHRGVGPNPILALLLTISFGWGCKQYPKTNREKVQNYLHAQQSSPTQPRVLPPPLQPAVVVAPLSPQEHQLKARNFLRDKNYGLAIHHAQQLAHLQEHQFTSDYLLGRIYSRQGNWKQAKRHYEKSLARNPTDLWANNNLGYVALELGLFTIAAQALERATLHPKAKGFMFSSLGIAYLETGRKEAALRAFNEAIRREPTNRLANEHRGTLHRELYTMRPPRIILPPGTEGYSSSSVNAIHLADSIQTTSAIGSKYELPP